MSKEEEFIDCVRLYVNYWNDQDKGKKESLEGLAFSILVALDGASGSFDGSVEDLQDSSMMLHDNFYKKDKNDEGEISGN